MLKRARACIVVTLNAWSILIRRFELHNGVFQFGAHVAVLLEVVPARKWFELFYLELFLELMGNVLLQNLLKRMLADLLEAPISYFRTLLRVHLLTQSLLPPSTVWTLTVVIRRDGLLLFHG